MPVKQIRHDMELFANEHPRSRAPARVAWMNARMPGICEPSSGWAPMIWIAGFFSFRNSIACSSPPVMSVNGAGAEATPGSP